MRFCFYRMVIVAACTVACLPAAGLSVVSVVRADARTGRLVRTVVVKQAHPSDESDAATSPAVGSLVEESAKANGVDPALVDSVIRVESNYNPYAVSPKGAQGLMQLMPATARRFGVRNSFDAKENIEGGVRYLKFLKETFKEDRLAIAAYNAGEGAVQKYNDVPPYPETVHYVAKVGKKYSQASRAAERNKPAPAPVEQKVAADEHRPLAQFVDEEGRLHIVTR
jgi:soluble lytic murein transglycosylase-like protein